ncbi:hypothetical protein D3C71_2132430 [compost metagenome]
MHQVAHPDHHHDGIEGRQVLGDRVVAGEQEGRQADQDNAFQRLVDALRQGALRAHQRSGTSAAMGLGSRLTIRHLKISTMSG